MFVDRKRELKYIEDEFNKEGFKFISIIGRRRVGKTRLIKQFLDLKKDFLYLYVPDSNDLNLRLEFSRKINETFKISFIGFPSWDEIIGKLFDYSLKKRIVVVMDEFQRFSRINKSVPSIIQRYADEYAEKSKMLLVTLGSSIGMMHKLFDYSSPLYGRRTGQINLSPFNYKNVRNWFKGKNEEEIIEIYAVFGGTPRYLEGVDQKLNIFKNIEKILSGRSPLYSEPELLLKTELTDPRTFFDILKNVSFGKCTPKEIGDTLDIKPTSIPYYLDILSNDLDLIRKELPVTEKTKSKMGRYFLKDNFFRFWFRYVFPNLSSLELGLSQRVMNSIKKDFNSFVGNIFEDICKESLISLNENNQLPFVFTDMSRWWNREGDEIDIVCLNKTRREISFAECKWQRKKVEKNLVEKLLEKKDSVSWNRGDRKEYFMVFSKSGFTGACMDYCKENEMMTFDLDDIRKSFEGR